MKIYRRLVTDAQGRVIEEDAFHYEGPVVRLMGGGSSAPAPDPNIGTAALQEAQLGQDYLSWAKQAYAQQQPALDQAQSLANQLSQAELTATNQQNTQAASLWQRYNDVYAPLQDQYASDVQNYASQANQDQAAGEAQNSVKNQYDLQTQAMQRNMARYGINPASGAYQQNSSIAANSEALAAATAGTAARTNVRNTGLALEGNAAQLGNSILSGANQTTSVGTGTSSTAQNIANTTNQTSAAATGIVSSGYQGALQGTASSAGILNNEYSNQLASWNASNNAQSGLFSGIAQIGTAAAMVY